MTPAINTAVAAVFLLAGALAVWTMTVMLGREAAPGRFPYRKIHRVSGWVFVFLLLFMFVTMFARIESFWEESPPRITLHFALAIALLFSVTVKVGVARYCKGLGKHLFGLGIGVYLLAFPMAIITGSYYIVRVVEGSPYLSHAELPDHLDEQLGKALMIDKCTTCHLLLDVLKPRTASDWEETVSRMVALARPRIKPMEGRQILNYLILNHTPRDMAAEERKGTPFQKYCSHCHTWAEMTPHRLDQEGWEKVVRRMHGHASELVPLEQVEEIAAYLAEKLGHSPAQERKNRAETR
jgi:hypothetical protein